MTPDPQARERMVEVHLLHQSQPIVRGDVLNTYTKDGLFCVLRRGHLVEKYPVLHIFRITEREPSDAQ
jgi:hypothetical protein